MATKMKRDDQFTLTKIGYTILPIEYRRVRDIMAEFDPREQVLRDALRIGHQLEITDAIAESAVLHIVLDSQMADKMHANRIPNPTLLQLIGTSRVISLNAKDAESRFIALIKEAN